MNLAERFLDAGRHELAALSAQLPSIHAAGQAVAAAWQSGGALQVSRSHHSLHEELVNRASGPVACQVLAGSEGPHDQAVHDLPGLHERDVVLVHSNCGTTRKVLSIVEAAKNRGAVTIALTQVQFETASSTQSAHPSGALLHELACITVDLGGHVGDGSIQLPGGAGSVGPTSGLTGIAAAWAIVSHACQIMVEARAQPLLLQAVQLPGAVEHNEAVTASWRSQRGVT